MNDYVAFFASSSAPSLSRDSKLEDLTYQVPIPVQPMGSISAFRVPDEVKKELEEFEDEIFDLLEKMDDYLLEDIIEQMQDNPREIRRFLKKIPWRIYDDRQPASISDRMAAAYDTALDKFIQITGWRKLMSLSISFEEKVKTSVTVIKHTRDTNSSEYIRLWLQYLANVCFTLGSVESDEVEDLMEFLCEFFDADTCSKDDVLMGRGISDTRTYVSGTVVGRNRIVADYYGKGSDYRMIRPNFGGNFEEVSLTISVSALLQYTIERNKDDPISLLTIRTCCALWPEAYASVSPKSANAIAALPASVYQNAIAQAHSSNGGGNA